MTPSGYFFGLASIPMIRSHQRAMIICARAENDLARYFDKIGLCRFGTNHAAHLAASTPARECHASEMMDSGLLPRVMLVTQRRHLAMAQMLEFA
jgi:hypothetical protein